MVQVHMEQIVPTKNLNVLAFLLEEAQALHINLTHQEKVQVLHVITVHQVHDQNLEDSVNKKEQLEHLK